MLEYDGPAEVLSRMTKGHRELRWLWNEIINYRNLSFYDCHFGRVDWDKTITKIGTTWWKSNGFRPQKLKQ